VPVRFPFGSPCRTDTVSVRQPVVRKGAGKVSNELAATNVIGTPTDLAMLASLD